MHPSLPDRPRRLGRRYLAVAAIASLAASAASAQHAAPTPRLAKPPEIAPPALKPLPLPTTVVVTPGRFAPDVRSLKRYEVPAWFRDAKFGIWSHWEAQSQPENDSWYARNMYIQGNPAYEHHVRTYGHPSVFGFKDIIQRWKAERFDPERLMTLYRQAGAKYFVAMGGHHDNYDLWKSRYHAWNAVNYGPKKDIVGLWRAAALRHGMKFGVSEHLARGYSWFNTSHGADTTGPLAGVPYDGNDPSFFDLYYPPHADSRVSYPVDAPDWVQRDWYYRMKDLIDNYRPDLIYSDGAIPFGQLGRQFLANYYNTNMRQNGGRLEAVYNIKDISDHGEYIDGAAVLDKERQRLLKIWPAPWQTDESTGPWFYNPGVDYAAEAVAKVHMLVDIVSKNGNLLLNITQRPDGSLDPGAEQMLRDMGAWMKVNGEAIYATRPWLAYGEGPSETAAAGEAAADKVFTPSDIRFTTKGAALYAIALGRPAGELTIRSIRVDSVRRGARVELLGLGQVRYRLDATRRLVIAVPKDYPGKYATTFKLTGFAASLQPKS